MIRNYFSLMSLCGILVFATSCDFEVWDRPSNWYGHWDAQRNEYEITGIDIGKDVATIQFGESDDNYNRGRFGETHSVKYKRSVKEFDNGCTFVCFTFEDALFVYPKYEFHADGSDTETIVAVKKVYVTTPGSPYGYLQFKMLDNKQSPYVCFQRME